MMLNSSYIFPELDNGEQRTGKRVSIKTSTDDHKSMGREIGKISSLDYQIKARHYLSYLVKAE
ncbi:hypothetical protein PN480_08140 [Dolichospermum circinale CS-1225]|uniref:Uncharacterized protein n=1 Tax=Dolichospermum circinale CS-537/01 TaxID=3021739 RepID=A0ABT5A3P4_9CYAN|nr:hypothetical protein [Dolichospermum circinale]MDB9458531.1 hypothetical protein [Dolichospermum circinale CS-545/17]MDB9468779.1 hypothetical protein [Dolichospermum circinale CS-539/09]MDB9472207.1 hypothetical protein [Dolichospermum circinale CS-539]MDB9486539.1 hypothetical protein [Dolichospermum circinale CS-537/01]MDB9521916.1 hypothetical protein [Dolichospermum circinale CS-1225]